MQGQIEPVRHATTPSQILITNAATMVVPGYISEVNTSFPKPGTYSFLCNEYCGLGHDSMWSRLIVQEAK